jgi:CRISPR-associated endonuclease Cas1
VQLVKLKVERQNLLLRKFRLKGIVAQPRTTLQEILLEEGRAAQQFWHNFKLLLPRSFGFVTRTPRATDPINRLLDIGYHHVTNQVRKILEQYKIPTDMGLLHVAHTSDSAPLAYDLVELFRSDLVDSEVLRFARLKKKALKAITQKDIGHLLASINRRQERKYYLVDFKICQTYRYYMELQILKFIRAVNHREVFAPLYLPVRHETRCRLTQNEGMLKSAQEFIEI